MYRTVLAAVNEHLNSEIAGRYALHLARAAGGRILLCSVRQRGQTARSFELAREAVRRLAHRAADLRVESMSLFDEGDPVDRLKAIVAAEHVDILFAATRREDVERRFWARTVSRRLSAKLSCSMALVRVVHLGRVRPLTILAPLKARMARVPEQAAFIALLAEGFGASVHLLHLAKPLHRFFHGEIHLTPLEWEANMPADMDRFIRELAVHGVRPERKLTPGAAGRGIAIEAAVKKHDLIVMGASERGPLSALLRGNPVERVLRETSSDLIILRPRLNEGLFAERPEQGQPV